MSFIDDLPKKHCRKCNKDKPIVSFGSNRNYKDGKDNICGDCRRLDSRQRYRKPTHGFVRL